MLRGKSRRRGRRDDDIDLESDESSRELRELIRLPACKSVLAGDVLSVDPAKSAQPVPEGFELVWFCKILGTRAQILISQG